MATLLPHQTTTVEDFIDSSTTINFTYDTLCLINHISDYSMYFPIFNVIDDYMEEIKAYSRICELTQAEYDDYYQAPKLLCHYIYGNSELDFLVMRLNGICDPKDFTMKNVRLLSKSDMTRILSQIYNANKKFIEEYNERNKE